MHIAQLFFLVKVPFLAVLKIKNGVWAYRHAHDVTLVTLILNIYGFVGLTSSVNRGYTDRQTGRLTDRLFSLHSIDNFFNFFTHVNPV